MSADSETYVPTKVLITGGAGFICSHVCNYLVNKYPDVLSVCIDCLDYCAKMKMKMNMKNLAESTGKPNFKVIQGNIRNSAFVRLILEAFQIDTVVSRQMKHYTFIQN
jgi:dTDP-D-glucose 4,6-dehydratase